MNDWSCGRRRVGLSRSVEAAVVEGCGVGGGWLMLSDMSIVVQV